jgi:hypothetical protein
MSSEKNLRKTKFICVEVAIHTDFDSDEFISYFEQQDHYVQKHPSEDRKWYIYFDPLPCKDANTTIRKICEMIENLPTKIRKAWDQATHREFYAGYEVGETPQCFQEHIEFDTLRLCVSLGAGIGFALYPAPSHQENITLK